MILLFSHKLSETQIEEAKKHWNVTDFIALPTDLQVLWSNISPDLESLGKLLEPVEAFLEENSREGDIVLIQGDFGMTFNMVMFAKQRKLIPIYATTERKIEEYIEKKIESNLKTTIENIK